MVLVRVWTVYTSKVNYVVHIPYGAVMIENDTSWHFIEPMVNAFPTAFQEVYADPQGGIRVFGVK